MRITSPEFGNREMIPKKFTCQGEDISPELRIEGIPDGTKSLALIVDDPDAPMGMWVHWVVFDIPVTGTIAEGSVPRKQGINDFKKIGYGGPCPPPGRPHRYFFKIYALRSPLDLKPGATKEELLDAMEGHVIEAAQLMGKFKR